MKMTHVLLLIIVFSTCINATSINAKVHEKRIKYKNGKIKEHQYVKTNKDNNKIYVKIKKNKKSGKLEYRVKSYQNILKGTIDATIWKYNSNKKVKYKKRVKENEFAKKKKHRYFLNTKK